MAQRMMWILWPSFIVAGAMAGIFFSAFDPTELHWFGEPLALSRLGVYTVGFFCFWLMGATCSAMSVLLSVGLPGREPGH